MLQNTEIYPATLTDTTDPSGTYRPNEPPVDTYGADFDPLDIPKRDPIVWGLLDTALGIFQRFIPEVLVEKWVKYTNESIVYVHRLVQQKARSKS